MQLPSILISGGNTDTRLAKAKNISPKAPAFAPTSIDEIREIRRLISLGQSVILEDAHNLTIEAQNALLKTLEEPPENTQILLLTPNSELLLPTILSRCQIIELPAKILEIPSDVKKDLEKVLSWVGDPAAAGPENGFTWAASVGSDRKVAIEIIDKLLILAHQHLSPASQDQVLRSSIVRSLFTAKKYLRANTNVRLTLENLFV